MAKKPSIDWQALATMPGSKDVGEKKFLILDAALNIISQQGLHALSNTSLSKQSGLSKSLILYHYKSIELILEDLFFYCGKLIRVYIDRNMQKAEGFEEQLMAMAQGLFEWVLIHRSVGDFVLLMYHEAGKTPGTQEVMNGIYQNANEILERIFLTSMRYDNMKKIVSLSRGVHFLLMGTVITMVTKKESDDYLKYVELLCENLNALLGIEVKKFKLNSI